MAKKIELKSPPGSTNSLLREAQKQVSEFGRSALARRPKGQNAQRFDQSHPLRHKNLSLTLF
jgi:hypothetical protein